MEFLNSLHRSRLFFLLITPPHFFINPLNNSSPFYYLFITPSPLLVSSPPFYHKDLSSPPFCHKSLNSFLSPLFFFPPSPPFFFVLKEWRKIQTLNSLNVLLLFFFFFFFFFLFFFFVLCYVFCFLFFGFWFLFFSLFSFLFILPVMSGATLWNYLVKGTMASVLSQVCVVVVVVVVVVMSHSSTGRTRIMEKGKKCLSPNSRKRQSPSC